MAALPGILGGDFEHAFGNVDADHPMIAALLAQKEQKASSSHWHINVKRVFAGRTDERIDCAMGMVEIEMQRFRDRSVIVVPRGIVIVQMNQFRAKSVEVRGFSLNRRFLVRFERDGHSVLAKFVRPI